MTDSGTSFSDLQAVVQAWHPMQRDWSTTFAHEGPGATAAESCSADGKRRGGEGGREATVGGLDNMTRSRREARPSDWIFAPPTADRTFPIMPADTPGCLFVGSRLVLAEGARALPPWRLVARWAADDPGRFPVRAGRGEAVAGLAAPGWEPPPGWTAANLRGVLTLLAEPELALALKAAHLARWRRTSRFCGECGARTALASCQQATKCLSCGRLAFPKISPAVIVQVTRGPRLLLGRSRRHPPGGWSVLAGFVDPGESLEGAVRREMREEAGVRVADVRYFGSQPWPFPDSLMVGFTAQYRDGALQRLDGELEDLAWFGPDELPPVPPSYSIARALVDDFARRHGADPAKLATWGR